MNMSFPTPHDLVPTLQLAPGPEPFFEALLILTFSLHILLVNATVGVAIICFFRSVCTKSSRLPDDLHKNLTSVPTLLAFTVNLGVPPFLFIQVLYGEFIYPSSIIMAVWWLSVAGIVMMAYYGFYLLSYSTKKLSKQRALFVLGCCTLLLLGNAFIFSNNMTLMGKPALWLTFLRSVTSTGITGTGHALADPTLLARFAHILPACLAVGGLFIAARASFTQQHGKAEYEQQVRYGLRWFTHATLVQILTGFWYFMVLPAASRSLFMGTAFWPTLTFLLGFLLTYAALFSAFKKRVGYTLCFTLLTIINMAYLRAVVRTQALSPFIKNEMPAAQSLIPLFLFIAAIIFTAACMIWIARIVYRNRNSTHSISAQPRQGGF